MSIYMQNILLTNMMQAASGEQEMIEGFAGGEAPGFREGEPVCFYLKSVCFPELLKSLHTVVFWRRQIIQWRQLLFEI